MRKSSWTPSIVPNGADQTVYLVEDCLERQGCVWREADCEQADLETVIADPMSGQYTILSASSRSTLPNAGRRTSRKTSRARSSVAPIWLMKTRRPRWIASLSATPARIGNWRCGWPDLLGSEAGRARRTAERQDSHDAAQHGAVRDGPAELRTAAPEVGNRHGTSGGSSRGSRATDVRQNGHVASHQPK